MILNYFHKTTLLTLLLTFLVSCTSMKELENYPIREIEKPHILPQGVFKSDFTGIFFIESKGDMAAGYIVPPLPFNTQYGLSDNLMVNFFLFIPASITWQIIHNKLNTLSLSFGVHSVFNYDSHGLFTTPFLSLNYTIRVSSRLAFLSEVDITSLIKQNQSSTVEGTPSKINDENISILSRRYSPGILFQLTDKFAVQYKHDFEYSYKYDFFMAPLSYRNAESDGKFFNRERLSFIINFNNRWKLQYEWIKNEASVTNFESYFWISLYW